MLNINRPVAGSAGAGNKKGKTNWLLIGALAVTVAVAIYLNVPTATVPSHAAVKRVSTYSDTDVAPDPDANVHFPRYAGGTRDPFAPLVVIAAAPTPKVVVRPVDNWNLTGITAIDGVQSALLENSKTGDSIFLQRGDHWNGTQVAQIGDESVTLVDTKGVRTTLGFADPDSSSSGHGGTSGQPGTNMPSIGSIGPLPPLSAGPIQPLTVTPSFPAGATNNESPNQQ